MKETWFFIFLQCSWFPLQYMGTEAFEHSKWCKRAIKLVLHYIYNVLKACNERISCEITSNFTNNYKETAADIKLKVKFWRRKTVILLSCNILIIIFITLIFFFHYSKWRLSFQAWKGCKSTKTVTYCKHSYALYFIPFIGIKVSVRNGSQFKSCLLK